MPCSWWPGRWQANSTLPTLSKVNVVIAVPLAPTDTSPGTDGVLRLRATRVPLVQVGRPDHALVVDRVAVDDDEPHQRPVASAAPAGDDGPVITEDDVRRAALSLPATTEKPSYGTPGFRVRDKLFARIREEGDVLVVWVDGLEEKDVLLAAAPDRFFTTPHYDGHPTVLVRFDAVEVDELTELLTDAWMVRAPARLRAELEATLGKEG